MTHDEDGIRLMEGDALTVLRDLPAASVQCCVTSPPYWGLRAYKAGAAEIGTEPTPDAYVAALVAVFGEVKRVLRDDGVLWLNLGDCYSAGGRGGGGKQDTSPGSLGLGVWKVDGIGPKQLVGIPWRVAFALQVDGWYLRSDVIWSKPNPMPESVRDRPTKAHEYVFLLSKSERYFWDQDAVREDFAEGTAERISQESLNTQQGGWKTEAYAEDFPGRKHRDRRPADVLRAMRDNGHSGRNIRTVWEIATQPSPLPHFAAFPDELASRCIKAGSAIGDTVLDPFAGTGTTLKVARELRRKAIGIELSPEYYALAVKRLRYGVKGVMAIQNGQGTLDRGMQ